MITARGARKPRTERVEAADYEAPAQLALPLRLREQRRLHDPVPEHLVRQFLRQGSGRQCVAPRADWGISAVVSG